MDATQQKKIAGHVVLVSTILLIFLLLIINIFGPAFNAIILLAQLVPLALTVPGQVKGLPRVIQWLCFVDLFFLVQGILLSFTPGRFLFGIIETAICLILFFSAIIFIRASQVIV